jgi:hypothetical protein
LCARKIGAWQAAEPALAAETASASLGDARLLRQRSVNFSMRGRSMSFGP